MPADSTPASVSVSGEPSGATPEVQKYRPRACQSCARSKMRCVWPQEPGATPCIRCSKIKAPCTLPELNPRRRRGPSTRVGQLEEKIDGIMSLLNASQQISGSPGSVAQTPPSGGALDQHRDRNGIQQLLNPVIEPMPESSRTPERQPDPISGQHVNARLVLPSPADLGNDTRSPSAAPPNIGHHRPTPPVVEYIEIVPGFRMTFDEADRALNLYRSVYAPYFPFVLIPVMLTAYELHDKKPFLFRTIISVTAPQSPVTQSEIKLWFREYIAQHVVVNNEKRLEILQAILVHLAWGDFHFYLDSQATNLIQLCVAQVIDQDLNKFPNDIGMISYSIVKEAATAQFRDRQNKQRTLDDMRAVLGCFYVTSISSMFFRRSCALPLNQYLNHCCEVIHDSEDYDSDKFLVTLVKMQRIINRVADSIPHADAESTTRYVFYSPLTMTLAAVRKELDTLIRDQPPEVECNALLWTHYHASLCRLYEPLIYMRSPPNPNDYNEAGARTEALWQCLTSARDFFTAYTAMPAHNVVSMPFIGAHLAFTVVTTSRLLFLDNDTDWEASVAKRMFDFTAVAARLSDFFNEADHVAMSLGRRRRFVDVDRSVLGMYRDKMKWIGQWYLSKTSQIQQQHPGNFPHDPNDMGPNNRVHADGRGNGGLAPKGLHPGSGAQGSNVGGDHGQAMDVDQPGDSQTVNEQFTIFPGELDEGFWAAWMALDASAATNIPTWVE